MFIREEVLPKYFDNLWIVRNSIDRKTCVILTDTTVSIAAKTGGSEIVARIVDDLKDSSEPFRRMVVDVIFKVLAKTGFSGISPRLEEQIIDGLIYCFQEQVLDETNQVLDACAGIVVTFGVRMKPYLPQLVGTLRARLNQPATSVRQQAADMIANIAHVLKVCNEERMLANIGLFLHEFLGEEYPDVLGSLLGALRSIVNVIGMENMTPPIRDLLPRLTPILKNRHEKVQENCVELIGTIAERGADLAPAREWNRICFDLLELLKAPKKSVRRQATRTFGFIANAIGPHDVIGALLNNLRVEERQIRICTTVAIAIVAETCGPFTVLPAMMNEYKVPDPNVQNGILKALSFMFEYLGDVAKNYAYALTPLLEDGLTDRDLVHRQTAAWAVKHMALGIAGLDCEDSLQHLFNYVFPNIFEVAPHMIQSFFDAMDAFRVSLGAGKMMPYVLSGMFHPARRVREAYWRVYNHLYIGAQHALVPAYPVIEDEGVHEYRMTELDLVL
jgi:splicing factor 3B subunit 1